jgi:hypothetical protein
MLSSVVNGRGVKVRVPSFNGTIYWATLGFVDASVAFKTLVVIVLLLILISLGKALFHLSRTGQDDGKKMLSALSWRIGLSVALFVLLIVAFYKGWINPAHIVP